MIFLEWFVWRQRSDMTTYSSSRRRSSITFQDYTRIKEALNQLKDQKRGIKRPNKENYVRNGHPPTTAIMRTMQFLMLGIVVVVVIYGILNMIWLNIYCENYWFIFYCGCMIYKSKNINSFIKLLYMYINVILWTKWWTNKLLVFNSVAI